MIDAEFAWITDEDLDPSQRADFAAYCYPRRGLDGRWYWPSDELLAAQTLEAGDG